LTRELAQRAAGELNTDDRTVTEFAFARTLGQANGSNEAALRAIATELKDDRPTVAGDLDWGRFEELRAFADARMAGAFSPPVPLAGERLARARARGAYLSGNAPAAFAAWRTQPAEPASRFDRLLRAEGLASLGDEAALADIELLRVDHPAEADLLTGLLRMRQGRHPEAADSLVAGFTALRADPLVDDGIVQRALGAARTLAPMTVTKAPALLASVRQPFAIHLAEMARVAVLLPIAAAAGDRALLDTFVSLEPYVPWTLSALARRLELYRAAGHPLIGRAEDDLHEFVTGQVQSLMGATSTDLGEAAGSAGAAVAP
jgi:hypothetical protein